MSIIRTGGIIGKRVVPTTSVTSGMWQLGEHEVARRAAIWPFLGDNNWDYVQLLLHMDGTNSSTVFTDVSNTPKTITATGSAAISTAQSKFGGASAVFSSGSYLSVANVGNIGTGDFTLEWWMRVTNVSLTQDIISTAVTGDLRVSLLAPFYGAGAIGIGRQSVAWDFYRNATLVNNTWHYCAISRESSTIRLYVDGSLVGTSATNSQSYLISGMTIGNSLGGYLDDIRLTIGSSRGYTGSTITVPTAAFPDPT